MSYRADIDGLRALAILLVVIFHFDIFEIGGGGFIGVDIFFVISGFLITGIIVKDLESGDFSLSTFYYRRVRRLYPAMLVTLLLYSAFGYFFFLPDDFAELAVEALLSQAYIVNFYFWQNVNYFGIPAGQVPLLHMWSLAVEEQFYLLYPLFCLAVFAVSRRALVPLLAVGLLASFALGVWLPGSRPEASFYLLPTRAWELALGALLFFLQRRWQPAPIVAEAAGFIGLACVGLALWLHTSATEVPGFFMLLPTTGAALMILAGGNGKKILTRILETPLAVGIGKISYPLYLVHWPIAISMKLMVDGYTLGWRLTGLTLSFFCAWVIYAAVESPIRKKSVLPDPRRFMAIAGGGTALLVVFFAAGYRSDGFPNRFSSEVVDLLEYSSDIPTQYRKCEYAEGMDAQANLCTLGASAAKPNQIVIGDSHAFALAGAFDEYSKQRGQAVNLVFSHACVPALDIGGRRCTSFMRDAVELAVSNLDIDTVYLVSIWRQPFEGDGLLFKGAWVTVPDRGAAFAEALTETVRKLTAAGKEVKIIEPLFSAAGDVPKMLAQNSAYGWDREIDTPLTDHQKQFARIFAIFDSLNQPRVTRISLIGELCSSGTCKAVWNGRPIFYDNNHVAFGMSRYFGEVLERELSR